MTDQDWLAQRFEEQRPRLRSVAYRLLGSVNEAEDAVQEAWVRLGRSDAASIDNLAGWFTTVVARVSLDMLRSRQSRREEPLGPHVTVPISSEEHDPEREALIADSVGNALLVILETLTPPERIAFVLHDMFGVPFDEIALIVERTPAAARKLASRARQRVRGAAAADVDLGRQREVVAAFLKASREGDFQALLALLAPGAVVRADAAAVLTGAPAELRGAGAVAEMFSGRARGARLALVGGAVGAAWAPGGRPRVAFAFTVEDGNVSAIDLIADEDQLARLDITIMSTSSPEG